MLCCVVLCCVVLYCVELSCVVLFVCIHADVRLVAELQLNDDILHKGCDSPRG